MRIPEQYEDFLALFVRQYPSYFWQFNFWGMTGGSALALETVSAVFPAVAHLHWWWRIGAIVLPAAVAAQLFQSKYRRRSQRLLREQAP